VKFDEKQFKVSEKEILLIMKAILASNYWQSNEYFRIINQNDELIPQALKLISNPVEYNRILGNQK